MSSQGKDTSEEVSSQIESLREEIHQLHQKVDLLSRFQGEKLVPVRDVVDADNNLPDSYSGMSKWMKRKGIPMRTRTGKPKPAGSRERSYVSVMEIRAEEGDTTRAVS